MAFYALERLINLHDGYRQPFSVNGTSLLLIQDEGRRYLILNQCPHQHAPLSNGVLSNGEIHCAYHGMRFNLESGTTLDGCNEKLHFFPISYDNSNIGVDL